MSGRTRTRGHLKSTDPFSRANIRAIAGWICALDPKQRRYIEESLQEICAGLKTIRQSMDRSIACLKARAT